MTKLSTREFVCPECDSSQDFMTYDSINVTLNPDFKEKLLNGELTTFKCENCGYSVETAYLLLYHDMDKKVMIYLDPNSELCGEQLEESSMLPSMLDPSYQFRIVITRNRNEMVEKILIFDDNLDDFPMELLKYYIRQTHLSKDDDQDNTILYFGGREIFEKEGEVVLINKLTGPDQKSFRVPIGKYREIKEGYTNYYPDPRPEAGRWLRVDENYFK